MWQNTHKKIRERWKSFGPNPVCRWSTMEENQIPVFGAERRRWGSCSGFIRISGLFSLASPSFVSFRLFLPHLFLLHFNLFLHHPSLSSSSPLSLSLPPNVPSSPYDGLAVNEIGPCRLFNFRDPAILFLSPGLYTLRWLTHLARDPPPSFPSGGARRNEGRTSLHGGIEEGLGKREGVWIGVQGRA